jgi:hypothetical protein
VINLGSTPLRISAELVRKARKEAANADRSLTGQVEHWLKLGMALETVLSHPQARELKKSATVDVHAALAKARTKSARTKALAHLRSTGEPRYGTDPKFPGKIIRIDPDGTRHVGRLVNRTFVADDAQ